MDNHNIVQLKREFIGRAEVKGFRFTQIVKAEKACLYRVQFNDKMYWEVFKIKVDTIPLSDQLYERYPTATAFGKWAWSFRSCKKAFAKLRELEFGKEDL